MLNGKKKECLLNVWLSRIDVGLGVLGSEVQDRDEVLRQLDLVEEGFWDVTAALTF